MGIVCQNWFDRNLGSSLWPQRLVRGVDFQRVTVLQKSSTAHTWGHSLWKRGRDPHKWHTGMLKSWAFVRTHRPQRDPYRRKSRTSSQFRPSRQLEVTRWIRLRYNFRISSRSRSKLLTNLEGRGLSETSWPSGRASRSTGTLWNSGKLQIASTGTVASLLRQWMCASQRDSCCKGSYIWAGLCSSPALHLSLTVVSFAPQTGYFTLLCHWWSDRRQPVPASL